MSLHGEEIDAVNAASLSGKLCQLANGGIYDAEHNSLFFHERKLDALEDLIEGANGRPVLVAYWFKHDLQRIQERFHVRENSNQPRHRRLEQRENSRSLYSPRVRRARSEFAGGREHTDLVRPDVVIGTVPADQRPPVAAGTAGGYRGDPPHHCRDTIDEQIMDALERKDTTQTALMNAVKAQLEV